MNSRLDNLPKNWRTKIRAVLPDDDIVPPWRDHFLDWMTDEIGEQIGYYFIFLEYGSNDKSPAPRNIAKRAGHLKKLANDLLGDLYNISNPQDQNQRALSLSLVRAFKEHAVDWSDLRKNLENFQDALDCLITNYDRPTPKGAPIKRADRMLTRGLVSVWASAYGKSPTVVNQKDGTLSGPFFDLLLAIQSMIGTRYSASGQWQWYKQLKGRQVKIGTA